MNPIHVMMMMMMVVGCLRILNSRSILITKDKFLSLINVNVTSGFKTKLSPTTTTDYPAIDFALVYLRKHIPPGRFGFSHITVKLQQWDATRWDEPISYTCPV
ncbi:hypothetical protein CRM22_008995 [Opisthorchis felineus]|uniref:Uncharacterized protein n=1 Tax=Opisthorchis felineus TaxID=147828 RepID=A0A4S2LGW5_OPIFE|nr:hypothetical protein CRM22_008995 [Opisthorchis felineus]